MNLEDLLSHRLAQVLYRCVEEVGSTKGAFYLLDGESGAMNLMSHYGWPRGTQPPERMEVDHPLLIWAHHERRSFVVNDSTHARELADFTMDAKIIRLLVSPVFERGDRIGLLIQRDRNKGGPYDLDRDEPPTMVICQDLVAAYREFLASLTAPPEPQPSPDPVDPALFQPQSMAGLQALISASEQGTSAPAAQAQPSVLPSNSSMAVISPDRVPATWLDADAIPIQVPPSRSIVDGVHSSQEAAQGEILEGFRPTKGGSSNFATVKLEDTDGSLRMMEASVPAQPMSLPPPRAVTGGSTAERSQRMGAFLPEQRTFFWETGALLSQVLSLAAVALWMDEPGEVRPILTYSDFSLSAELKQQIMAHTTFHVSRVQQADLRILSKVEHLEHAPLQGAFLYYLPVVLKEEGGGQDLLMLFRMDNRPFTAAEQGLIQRAARMLGFHLQESRLHERYHRAFLFVSHGILSSAETRSPKLKSHSLNTAKLARNLALRMELPSSEVEAVSIAAILHDVGTLLLDPELFTKQQLSPEEWARIRMHPLLALTFLKDMRFPFDVLGIIRHHHERWDGQGYPDNLKGESIPVGSRIIAVIESYEVMSAGTPWKSPMTSREIRDELRRESGFQFDPTVVSEFLAMLAAKLGA